MSEEIIKILNSHGEQLKSINETVKSHGEQLDVIASTVLGNSDRLDNVESKLEKLPTVERLDHAINKADEVLKKVIDREQENVMRSYGIKRVEEKTDKNAQEIQKIKPLVGLA